MIEWVKDDKDFSRAEEKNHELLMLFFYADFSSAAKRSLSEIKQFSEENKQVPIYIVDVQKISGIHKRFGVESIPTVLMLQKGKVTKKIEGVESSKYYSSILSGIHSTHFRTGHKKTAPQVTVYVSPGCPHCGSAKAYLQHQGLQIRVIDISRDRYAAERLAQRSGQMAVPQIDINGQLVIGFDKAKIDRLLST